MDEARRLPRHPDRDRGLVRVVRRRHQLHLQADGAPDRTPLTTHPRTDSDWWRDPSAACSRHATSRGFEETMMTPEPSLSNLLHETRHFDPPEDLAAHANLTADAYDEAEADRLAFWAKQAER